MNRRVAGLAVVLLLLLAGAPAKVSGQEKPLLSDEIRAVMDRDGAEAALGRFEEIFPARRQEWNVDIQGLNELGAGYVQAGEMEKFEAVMEMVAAVTRVLMDEAAAEFDLPREEDDPEPSAAEPEPRRGGMEMGEPRDDLERFVGQYGDPAAQSQGRNLFAAVRCDGYLVVGATWGDASNWHLRSTGPTTFETVDYRGETIRFAFELDGDGAPTAMTHDLEFMASPLQYLGGLPEGWGDDCILPPGG